MSSPEIKSILLLIFPGFNTLDANGPLEVFRNVALNSDDHPDGYFKVTVAAADEFTTAAEGITVKRDLDIRDIIKENTLENYDILLIPGGPVTLVMKEIEKKDSFSDAVVQFAQPKIRPPGQRAIILSICSGALFLGHLGILTGLRATTHWKVLEQLEKAIADYVGSQQEGGRNPEGTTVTRERYIDNGYRDGLRVITAGGISCGLDASIYLVSDLVGREQAKAVADVMDYTWRGLN